MPEAPAIATPPRSKRLAVLLDGTWNAVGDNTNVWRVRSLCAPAGTDGSVQRSYYEKGVNGALGGLFGYGLDRDITDAYQWLIENYDPGDDTFIFGFSRGAYTARSLAGFIAKCGLLKPGAPLGVNQLYNRYRRKDELTIWELLDESGGGAPAGATIEEQWMIKYSMAIHIKFVGVWETVGELGIPFLNIPGISRSTLGFLTTGLRRPIDNGFHALAIDEHRRAFSPTLWTIKTGGKTDPETYPPRPLTDVEQRWFVGAHANVGGGYESDLLPQIPLRWLMRKASLHGLAFRNDVELDGNVLTAPISDSYREFMYGIYHHFSPPYYRPIGAPPAQTEDGATTNVNETIDASVFARWNSDGSYRPPNLTDWATRRGADISALNASVIADTPNLPAPD
ncbi:MAG TPA: DUF2235 domain-containing protein [Xanthobacteraceae bacterium]|nr:DUF2235 domain-containing protein [Xanthobacteraceae bacterium]